MLSQWIHSWVSAGTHSSTLNYGSIRNLSHIYVTNLICLAVSFFLIIQIPFYLSSTVAFYQPKIELIIVHVVALSLIPIINRHHWYLSASFLFYCVYGSYILLSSILVNFQADTHLFFLLGLFVIPFIFPSKRENLRLTLSLVYMSAFLVIEWYSRVQMPGEYMQPTVKPVNRLIFAVTCLVCALQVHHITAKSWGRENRERTNSESLLSNILPYHIAKVLKEAPQPIAKYHSNVPILFADIEGFTTLSSQLDPMVLVNLLDELFSHFDEICAEHQLEKIKTLGDGYMVVGGLDENANDHPNAACQCAKEMREAYSNFSTKHDLLQGIRIGLNTGPVVAGVIGKSKYTFDVWGEAVNLAARMQSHGETDKIQVSETTFNLTKDTFEFSPKRQLLIKGMGNKQAYWLLEKS